MGESTNLSHHCGIIIITVAIHTHTNTQQSTWSTVPWYSVFSRSHRLTPERALLRFVYRCYEPQVPHWSSLLSLALSMSFGTPSQWANRYVAGKTLSHEAIAGCEKRHNQSSKWGWNVNRNYSNTVSYYRHVTTLVHVKQSFITLFLIWI